MIFCCVRSPPAKVTCPLAARKSVIQHTWKREHRNILHNNLPRPPPLGDCEALTNIVFACAGGGSPRDDAGNLLIDEV